MHSFTLLIYIYYSYERILTMSCQLFNWSFSPKPAPVNLNCSRQTKVQSEKGKNPLIKSDSSISSTKDILVLSDFQMSPMSKVNLNVNYDEQSMNERELSAARDSH